MREFRKKQKITKFIMNIVCVFTALFMIVFIGIEPKLSGELVNIANYLSYVFIIASMVILFVYFNKYSKSDKFLEAIENELSDVGYYYTSRKENNIVDYENAVINDLKANGFSIDTNVEAEELYFNYRAVKGKSIFYIVCLDEVDKNDIIAYQESAIYDTTSVIIKRKANVVMLYICNNADNGAISLSKMITPLGKKEQIKIANAIVELNSKRCYFLGNKPTKNQQLIANYAMNCDLPLKEKYIGNEKLSFQNELEEHMKDFNIKDFKNGNFYAH